MKVQTTTQEKKQFEVVHVPTGIYLAEFVEEKQLEDHKDYGSQSALLFEFEHETKKYRLPFRVYTKYPATKKNKLGKAVMALGGKIDDKEYDTKDMLGAKVNIYIKEYDKEIDQNGKKSVIKASYIEDLIPVNQKV